MTTSGHSQHHAKHDHLVTDAPFFASSSYDQGLSSISTAAMGWTYVLRSELWEDLIHLHTHCVGPSQGFAAGLGRSDITEFSLLDQFLERPGRFLDRYFGVDSSTLEQVQLLASPEVLVDVIDTAPQAFLTVNLLSHHQGESER